MVDLDGLISINKPPEISSFGAVKNLKKILGIKKAGHCGTLDPMATGVLLVLLGRSTKLQNSFMELRKCYRAKFLLGITTDTGDITGKVTARKEYREMKPEKIMEILNSFIGEIEQVPPMYSALRYGGKRLYELARKGIEVERFPRKIKIYNIEFISLYDNMLEIRVECSKGTYIRSLGEDIGKKLGCGATMTYLCREKVGPFSVTDAFSLDTLKNLDKKTVVGKIIPENALPSFIKGD